MKCLQLLSVESSEAVFVPRIAVCVALFASATAMSATAMSATPTKLSSINARDLRMHCRRKSFLAARQQHTISSILSRSRIIEHHPQHLMQAHTMATYAL